MTHWHFSLGGVAIIVFALLMWLFLAHTTLGTVDYSKDEVLTEVVTSTVSEGVTEPIPEPMPEAWPYTLNTEEYNERILALSHYKPPKPIVVTSTSTVNGTTTIATSTKPAPSPLRYSDDSNVTVEGSAWPPSAVYPNEGALVPFNRILAYYGNFYSTRMGILGELPEAEMLAHLAEAQKMWEEADPDTPVIPAIEYIASVAQADAGVDGMYRAVMPEDQIEYGYELAQKIGGIYILDIQVGLSPLRNELPKFKKYLERPDVHFALDPEFSMKSGRPPGTVIGTFDAADINYTINWMSEIVRENQLPPKILIVHRFTQDMVTNSALIEPTPEVQVIMVMDGWGSKQLKYGTYSHVIEPEPVQFTGIKIFYKNDLKPPSTGILTPMEVLNLDPTPIYIQYQ